MGKPVKQETKKPYTKPTLTVYWTVRELTQSTGKSGMRDGGRAAGANKTNI